MQPRDIELNSNLIAHETSKSSLAALEKVFKPTLCIYATNDTFSANHDTFLSRLRM